MAAGHLIQALASLLLFGQSKSKAVTKILMLMVAAMQAHRLKK